MKNLFFILLPVFILTNFAGADDLYRVRITSQSDAELLRSGKTEPVCRLSGAYLVLSDSRTMQELSQSGLQSTFLAADLELEEIFIDSRFDRKNAALYQVIFEQEGLRLLRANADKALSVDGAPLIPAGNNRIRIEYRPPMTFNKNVLWGDVSLDSLIDGVSQDSADLYLHRLEAFFGRVTGTDSLFAARDWIADKFASFGYAFVMIDTFMYNSDSDTGYNVVAVKTGTRYPGRQIVIGGHFDAVPDSPGADDNGTGTVGVLEMARALSDVETEMTFIFIAFDAEEIGLIGSRDYANEAAARGDTIVYMLNMDMIGHIENDSLASLHQGPDDEPYAYLWEKLADSLVGITGFITGPSGGSDHYWFGQNGYDVTFVQEFYFSTEYHLPSDSTTYIDFDYLTRMIKASLATAYTVNHAPLPVIISSIIDVGNGQSLQINWPPADPGEIDHFWLHYEERPPVQPDSILVPSDSSSYIITGLDEGQEYSFHIIAFDADGRSSVAFDQVAYGTPYSIPVPPQGIAAYPLRDSIRIIWAENNTELDFHHYAIFRDGFLLPDSAFDNIYIDNDPALDTGFHEYMIAAVDIDGNMSDTTGAPRDSMKVARLEANRILAVNRSASNSQAMVNEVVTGEFLREALTGWEYDYFSDTSASNNNRAGLFNMIDYDLVVFGAESGRRQDDIGGSPDFGGILEEIAYYLSIGGKAIIFGRWGDIDFEYDTDSVFFNPGNWEFVYSDYFNIFFRILPLTYLSTEFATLESDFIGAFGQFPEYPELVWDQAATFDHSGSLYAGISGIPCPSFPHLIAGDYDVIYTYNSSSDSALTEGQPLAWRYLGEDYKYVFFEIPLSFMQRPAAVTALRQAITDMGIISDVDDDNTHSSLPTRFSLSQNYPNPFNPSTIIEFYNPSIKPAKATLEIFNILGQRTRLLFDGMAAPGENRVEWDGCDESGNRVATGIYFYRLKTDAATMTRKMILLK